MMSHRRKSARPTNKLRRNAADTSSVSSDGSDAADHNTKMVLEEYIHKDTADSLPPGPAPQLALPPDLWQDFQELQAATHLDTASLIRRLIHQYGRSGSQDEVSQVASTDETDSTLCGEERPRSPCSGEKFVVSGGETAYYGEEAACYGGDIEMVAPDYHTGPAVSVAEEDDECLILDLSSGVRATNDSASSGPAPDDTKMGYRDEGDPDLESPLDLTVSKARGVVSREGMEEVGLNKAPNAHRTPSSTALLSSLSHGVLCSAVATSSVPSQQPREAHSALSASGLSPRHVSSSLFNLSDFHLAGQRVCSAAQTDKPKSKLSCSSGGTWSEDIHSKQKIVQHFLSLPAGQVISPETHQDLYEKQGSAMKANCSESLRHLSLSSAASQHTSVSSMNKNVSRLPSGSETMTTAAGMKLPTVTAFEFQGAAKQLSTEQEAVSTSQMAVSLASLPTSASAILLDVSSGGLVATAGGSLAGVSTVNIPLMATGAGGLVAIPLLHALPEALAAAASAVAAQGQASHQSSPSTPPTSQPHPPPPPPQQAIHEIPPPPPYSAAVASTTPPKKYKAKIGRPRGQPKAPKAIPKDMKLLTENTLFPGVYTSILKLPWSKRSRGKSSAKIKDVVANTSATSNVAAAAFPEQNCAADQREPGEITNGQQQQQLQQQQQQLEISSTTASDVAPLGLLSMPVLVPDQTSVISSTSSSSSSMTSSSSSSVMMVYQNSTVSEMGKPVRRRGRPPKLPVLSQLLTEKISAVDCHQVEGQAAPLDSLLNATTFSLVPVASHSGLDSSAMGLSTSVVDSQAVAFPTVIKQNHVTKIKQEPMEVTDIQGSKLFAALPPRDRGEDSNHLGFKHQALQQIKLEAEEGAASPCAGDGSSKEESGATERDTVDRVEGEKLQEASLETRFNILANQLGLELGSPYHASLVYSQSAAAAGQTTNSSLYQQMMLSSRSLVEMKPRRRQLNNLIKPSDDCVYTSFRIRPRNSGRRGGKRGGRRRGGSGSKYNTSKGTSVQDDFRAKDVFYQDKEGSSDTGDSGTIGSAVITERIPGAGEVPQRLYQDLYHCKLCNELLPADNSLPHTCNTSVSPPLRSCDMCGTMYLSSDPHSEVPAHPNLCEDCVRKGQRSSGASLSPDTAQDQHVSEGFACQPCGVQFVNIADYIQHRRSAHLEKMIRQARKTHTLKTLPCPAQGCPRLFHMHAELTRHINSDHPEEAERVMGSKEVPASPSNVHQDHNQDVDVETITETEEVNCTGEEHPQFTCTQNGCEEHFSTPIDLLEHVQNAHENVSQWPCPLPGCTRQFSAERHLRVHLLMHKDEKPLNCPLCHYRCRQKNALLWHMRKHPEAAGQYRKFAGMSADS